MTTFDQPAFFATETGGRKHLAQCPHLVGKQVAPVAPERSLEVCDWCSRELSGHGRTVYEHLDAALDALGAPVQNRALIKDALKGVEHDSVYLPYSASYLGLTLGGKGVAWSGKTYVVPAPGQYVTLPDYNGSEHKGLGGDGEKAWGDTCHGCFQKRSLSGECRCTE